MHIKLPKLPAEFAESNARDEQQIQTIAIDPDTVQALFYHHRESDSHCLSYAGIRTLADTIGNIEVGNPSVEETPGSYLAVVPATNHSNHVRMVGVAHQPRRGRNGVLDPFAYESAVGKASRNALFKVIPESVQRAFLVKCIEEARRAERFDPEQAYSRCLQAFGKPRVKGYILSQHPYCDPMELSRGEYLTLWRELST